MKNDFEKMDEKMMETFRSQREEKFSQKYLDQFHADVVKKAAALGAPGYGMPSLGLVFCAALSLAVLAGVVFYLHRAPVKELKTEEKAVHAQPAVSQAPEPVVVKAEPPASVVEAPSLQTAPLQDDEILEEIEALKDLGVWNDQDEEGVGIAPEILLEEVLEFSPEGMVSIPIA